MLGRAINRDLVGKYDLPVTLTCQRETEERERERERERFEPDTVGLIN